MFFGGKKKQNNGKKIKGPILLGSIFVLTDIVVGLFYFLRPRRWRAFIKGQRREIKELTHGEESFGRFSKDSASLLKDLFIPHEGNNHRPKILRPKSLASYAIVAVGVKIVVTGFLFFTYPTPAELSAIISKNMIALINQARQEQGVQPLSESTVLDSFALTKGQDMIARNYFAHNTPEGKKPWEWINRSAYDYVYAGENLAMDFTSAETVEDAFMKSPSHRHNILNSNYHDVGIAVLNGELNGHQTTLLVEFFGTQRKDLPTLAAGTPTPRAVPVVTTTPAPSGANEQTTLGASQAPASAAAAPQNEVAIAVTTHPSATRDLVDWVIEYSNIFFIAFLLFVGLSLALNIFIKIRIQHPPLIFQSIAVLALLAAMLLLKLHFIETISPQLLIL